MTSFEEYDFDIKEMINSFNFEDLIKIGCRGAVLLVTNKQYILSYTDDYGKGNHGKRLNKILKYIFNGNNYLNTTRQIIKANMYSDKKHISIYFYHLDNLNKENFKNFMNFYDDNKDALNFISQKYSLEIGFYDKYNNKNINTDNFNELISYFKNYIKDNNEEYNDDEIIIGIPTNKNLKTM